MERGEYRKPFRRAVEMARTLIFHDYWDLHTLPEASLPPPVEPVTRTIPSVPLPQSYHLTEEGLQSEKAFFESLHIEE